MEVILKEDVPKLGSRGEVVKVAEGYGGIFCFPRSWRFRPLSQQDCHRADEGRVRCAAPPRKDGSRSAGQAV